MKLIQLKLRQFLKLLIFHLLFISRIVWHALWAVKLSKFRSANGYPNGQDGAILTFLDSPLCSCEPKKRFSSLVCTMKTVLQENTETLCLPLTIWSSIIKKWVLKNESKTKTKLICRFKPFQNAFVSQKEVNFFLFGCIVPFISTRSIQDLALTKKTQIICFLAPCESFNDSFIDQACLVNFVGNCPRSFWGCIQTWARPYPTLWPTQNFIFLPKKGKKITTYQSGIKHWEVEGWPPSFSSGQYKMWTAD